MTIEEDFRFDTRIRERMLKKGAISPEEVETRLSALQDREQDAVTVDLEQPAVAASRGEAG